jgi:hypothetical protein
MMDKESEYHNMFQRNEQRSQDSRESPHTAPTGILPIVCFLHQQPLWERTGGFRAAR